jgi:hypothetical protein
MFTALATAPLRRKSRTSIAASSATFSWASAVDAPRCGVRTTFGAPRSGWSGGAGSVENTSMPAPAMVPARSASASACSSTIPPRETFSTRAVFFICASSAAPTRFFVSGVSGMWNVRKSTRGSRSARFVAGFRPSSAARAEVTNGS